MKIPLEWCVLGVSTFGIAFILFAPFFTPSTPFTPRPVIEPVWSPTTQVKRLFTSKPVIIPAILDAAPNRLLIQVLGIDAPIEQVGLTMEGAMDTPQNPEDAAWFRDGILPGQIGTAAIDGHLDWIHGEPALFTHLSALHKGDYIQVRDENGHVTTFVVTSLHTYNKSESTMGVFSSNDGISHLNLITCEGTWNAKLQTYTDRLVVFSDRVH